MQIFEVGKQVMNPGYDGVFFDVADDGATLVIRMGAPTSKEKQAFKSGISLRYTIVESVIFILARMGTMQWMDAPYYVGLSRNLTSCFKLPKDGEGLSVHALFVDGNTGILIAQKLMGLNTDGSLKLIKAIEDQEIIPDYHTRLQKVYAQYTTDDMVKDSVSLH